MTNLDKSQAVNKYIQFLESDEDDPVTLYLEGLAITGRRSMRSLLHKASDVFGFEGELTKMPWPLLQYQHIAKLRAELQNEGKAANTINLSIAACRGVMKACFNLGLIKADQLMLINEVKRVRGKKLPSGRKLLEREIKALIGVCKRDKTIAGRRDLAVVTLMLSTGLRRSEVVSLNIDDYNSRNGELTVKAGKGNKQRLVFIQVDARQLIKPWLNCRGKSAGQFFYPINNKIAIIQRQMTTQSLYDLIKKRSVDAGINHCSPHDLRRTFVTRLLESGIDINTVRQLAGHSDIQTTARYDLRDDREQRRAMKQNFMLI